jgi:hypothetical protein
VDIISLNLDKLRNLEYLGKFKVHIEDEEVNIYLPEDIVEKLKFSTDGNLDITEKEIKGTKVLVINQIK